MRSRDIIIFLTIVFVIYAGANTFLYFKGADAFKGIFDRGAYTILFILLSMTFIAGKVLERQYPSFLSELLNITGGFWLAFMLYSVLFIIVADVLSLLLSAAGFIPFDRLALFRQSSYLASMALALVIITAGFVNTFFPKTRHYHIDLDKSAGTGELKIAAVSDMHLGSIIGKRSIRILSGKLRDLSPDMILFLGDIVDGEIKPVLRKDLLELLDLPSSARHVYGVMGNHEYIGDPAKTLPYIESKGIKLLLDKMVSLDNGIQLAGRKDRDSFRYKGEQRMALSKLLRDADHDRPLILMDHQPPMKKDRDLSGFDIMLSGHTHNGQMWPLNYLTGSIYKLIYGHRVIEGRHYIVSSGFGSWGPRVRLGSRPEILCIHLHFKGQAG
ncbi:MAG: metallophosphoesterase [Bacteroidales bacterium]|nr:metallophosphoesterase [Bacteroidales bacterium]